MNWFVIAPGVAFFAIVIWGVVAQRKDKRAMEAAREKFNDPAYWAAKAAENLAHDPYVKPAWATHQIELTDDYVWYHMLVDVIRKGTICDARMTPEGHWMAHVNTGLTKGNFTFPDDIVKILKHY
jgi:hypothetical protein